jgi:dihydrodipicolinate synthase/N-acetylneuraminate lyase
MPQGKAAPPPNGGVYAALVTPRRPDTGEADCSAYLEYLDKVTEAGVDGLVFFGSTGEFVHFASEDRMRVASLGVKRSRVPVLVNVSQTTLLGACDLVRHAAKIGAAGVLLMPPYFYRYSDDQIARFYEEFLKVADGVIPVYLYNLPQFTSPISNELAARLLESGAYAGIKDSSGDWTAFEILKEIRERQAFQLMLGNEDIYLQGLMAGADGAVSGVAAAVPELPVSIYKAVQSGELVQAERLAASLAEFLAWIVRLPSTVAIKQAAEARGWLKADLAVPLSEQYAAEVKKFREWLDDWLPLTLEACANTVGVRT